MHEELQAARQEKSSSAAIVAPGPATLDATQIELLLSKVRQTDEFQEFVKVDEVKEAFEKLTDSFQRRMADQAQLQAEQMARMTSQITLLKSGRLAKAVIEDDQLADLVNKPLKLEDITSLRELNSANKFDSIERPNRMLDIAACEDLDMGYNLLSKERNYNAGQPHLAPGSTPKFQEKLTGT